jgi:hypothetical protein
MELTITPMPGRYGRPFFRSERQRYHRGGYIDLSDPVSAKEKIMVAMRQYGVKEMDIVAGPRATTPISTVPLTDVPPIPLAGPTAEPTPDMSPSSFTPIGRSEQAPQQQQQQQYQQGPPNLDPMTMFLYQQQEQRFQELKGRLEDNKELLKIEKETNRSLQEELNHCKLDLQLKDRTHELTVREMRNEFEGQTAPKGFAGALAGLPPEVVSSAMPAVMQGLMGIFTNLMGAGAAAPAQAALPPGLSPKMQNVVQAATQIFPDEETAHHVMVALTKILPDEDKLTQFFHLAGITAPQTAQPQYAN